MPKLFVALLVFLFGCATQSASGVHVITYPWQCGEPRFDCYVLGYEVAQGEAIERSRQVCLDGVYNVIPNQATDKALIICN